jgi:predicted O-methyltransferase YrrM
MIKGFRDPTFNGGRERSVIPEEFDATIELARLCYLLVRLTKPLTVVETGVGRGFTSCYILKALRENKKGHLYSIDLPMLKWDARKHIGMLVPSSLRSRWTLIFGPGIDEMKKLRKKLENIDMFVHDSNHTYLNQLAEYQIAMTWLKKNGILISDDVKNDALLEVCERFKGEIIVTKQSKPEYVGIVVK